MAADIGAVVLTVACAAIAGSCALLLLKLWQSGSASHSGRRRP